MCARAAAAAAAAAALLEIKSVMFGTHGCLADDGAAAAVEEAITI